MAFSKPKRYDRVIAHAYDVAYADRFDNFEMMDLGFRKRRSPSTALFRIPAGAQTPGAALTSNSNRSPFLQEHMWLPISDLPLLQDASDLPFAYVHVAIG